MSDYVQSYLALGGQLEFLSLAGLAICALFLFGLARQYYLRFSVPPAFHVRPWYPIPADLPTGPVAPYGAPELRSSYRRNLLAGINGSAGAHVTIIIIAFLLAGVGRQAVVPPDNGLRWKEAPTWTSPPPLDPEEAQSSLPLAYEPRLPPPPMSHIAIPVADFQAFSEATIMGNNEIDLGADWDDRGEYDIFSKGPGSPGPGGDGMRPSINTSDPSVVSLDLVERLPELITIPTPEYPVMAREAGAEGIVNLDILVGSDGRVRDVKVVKSIPMLDEAAIAAARNAVFRPAFWRNNPVAVRVTLPIRFSLTE